MTDGVILWEGKSRINGEKIVAIATRLTTKSENEKTGDMVQTWILCVDNSPGESARAGKDVAVCGDCVHRAYGGLGSCYLNLAWAPTAIWRAYRSNKYRYATIDERRLIRSKKVRIGAYGDPVAVPVAIWQDILPSDRNHVGYTHQWKKVQARSYGAFLMASVDTEEELIEARKRGWRCFYVVEKGTDKLPQGVRWCLADAERVGKLTHCDDCLLCHGNPRDKKPFRDIAIHVHGKRANTYSITQRRRTESPLARRAVEQVKFVRLPPTLHANVKRAAKAQRKSLKAFVHEALVAKMNEKLLCSGTT